MSQLTTPDYPAFLTEIKARIRSAQYQALRAVNKELLALYWDLGESIYQKQEVLGWGKAVVKTLADDLRLEFPGSTGFSVTNLWLMRQFYAEYRSLPNLQPMVGEISWAKNVVIMGRCKDLMEREFYLRATARFGWTKAVLQHQLDGKSYEKYLKNLTIKLFCPNGASQASPGQRPGNRIPAPIEGQRPGPNAAQRLERAFSPRISGNG